METELATGAIRRWEYTNVCAAARLQDVQRAMHVDLYIGGRSLIRKGNTDQCREMKHCIAPMDKIPHEIRVRDVS
jgi:hypothetical protein